MGRTLAEDSWSPIAFVLILGPVNFRDLCDNWNILPILTVFFDKS